MEIGTYVGESINILTDCCEKLYSVTAPVDGPFSMRTWCRNNKLPDYSERLTYNEKIIHYFCDSKQFDFSKHGDMVDLILLMVIIVIRGCIVIQKMFFAVRIKMPL